MATPKFNKVAEAFVKKIPDTLPDFNPLAGVALPSTANGISAATVSSYVNRALQRLFNMYWETLGEKIGRLIPELEKWSDEITLTSGTYEIDDPHFDFYKIIGAINNTNNKFIRVKDSSKFTLYTTEKYDEYVPTVESPVIIQLESKLYVFPTSVTKIRMQYVRYPVNFVTGGYFIQNDNQDSPFYDHWLEMLSDIAYEIFLKEA